VDRQRWVYGRESFAQRARAVAATDESVGVLTVIALAAAARLGDARTATDRGDTSPRRP
jgi:hypothetical protein